MEWKAATLARFICFCHYFCGMSQVFIGITGLQATGKTTLAKKIVKEFNINHVRTDAIRDFLIKELTYYHDADYSHHNPKIDSANVIVANCRDMTVKELLKQKQSVMLDACGSTRAKRKERIKNVKRANPDIKTILIHVKEKHEKIISRLSERDAETGHKWVEYFKKFWVENYEEPTEDEADYIIVAENNDTKVIKKLREIIKK